MKIKEAINMIDNDGKPFTHFERGVIYTAKVARRGVIVEKRENIYKKNNLPFLGKAVKIDD